MKSIYRSYLIVVALAAMLLSACGGAQAAAPAKQAAVKVDASPIAYTGTVESIVGDQWVVSGQLLTVNPAVIQDGPFQVGDTIKVEGDVNPDGSFTVTRVEMPSADDLAQLPQIGDNPATDNANNNDANANDANVNDDNGNNDNGNINDDNSNDANSNDDDDNSNSSIGNNNDDDDNSNDANSNDDDDSDDDSSDSNGNDDDNEDDNSNSSDDDSNTNGS